MASLSKPVVLFAILFLPSRLFGQVHQSIQQPTETRPTPAAAVPLPEAAVQVDGPVQSCRAALCGAWDGTDCQRPREAVFLFGGQFTTGSMGDTTDIANVTYDDNFIIGLGYQRLPWSLWCFDLGWEVGLAGRFGDRSTGELWAGMVLRHQGFTIPDLLTITPSITAGFSVVTESQGFERHREYGRSGNATFLYYLGPEIALSTPSRPNVEVFWRLHHRCGGGESLGGMVEGYNANVFGVRFRF